MSCCQSTNHLPFSSLYPYSFCLSLSPCTHLSPCLSLTYALCLVFPVSLALSHSCSVSHLYKELSAHSSGHSDESVWMKGRSHRPELMLLLHIRNVWNADRLHTLEPQNKTLWRSFTVIPFGSDALCPDGPTTCTAVLHSGIRVLLKLPPLLLLLLQLLPPLLFFTTAGSAATATFACVTQLLWLLQGLIGQLWQKQHCSQWGYPG